MTKTEIFIEKAYKLHGDKYDYSKVEYINNKTKVCIICPEHGEFWQIPNSHLLGAGCPKCSNSYKLNTTTFIEKARKVHGDKYDYSKVNYVSSATKVCIICPEHGEFWQKPNHHLQSKGCLKCAYNNSKLTIKEFIEKARKIHGDKYDYSKVKYINTYTKVCIICPKHGEFWQKPNSHIRGVGCPICNVGFSKLNKISLLQNKDLINLSSHQLIELINDNKLPSDFKSLIYTPLGSKLRIDAINTLLGKLANSVDKQPLENIKITETFDEIINQESESEYIQGNSKIYDELRIKPDGQSSEFLIAEELHKLWNKVIKADDSNKLSEILSKINTQEGGEFWKYVQTTFLDEYYKVNNIKQTEAYKFSYKPSLMQKLIVYRLMSRNSYGNWSGTGSGKTNSFLFATRKLDTRVNLMIVPNDTIKGLIKAINSIYPDSKIYTPQSFKELISYDRNKFNYIIYNYEKFQSNNHAEETINKLLETNVIDFICLDEIQNVKVRDERYTSTRNKYINDLVKRARVLNPDMKILAMSATPCINNLTEIRSIIKILTDEDQSDIGSTNTILNIHNAYKALLLNGFRYVPKYPMDIEERIIELNCSDDTDFQTELVSTNKHQLNKFEYILAKRKLDVVKNELKHGTIVYSNWVEDMSEMLVNNIKSWGFTVEAYNGELDKNERRDVFNKFLNDEIDVLVCSKPISTGIDGLQYKCNKMIIISLPWTDADYMQLKGRIYRQGSNFKRVEFVIPQIVMKSEDNEWSWDKMRKQAIDNKKSLATAIVEGHIQKSYTINREQLLEEAKKSLEELK